MAKIYAPNKQYTGISASVAFAQGVGETTDPYLIDWFKAHGYEVGEVTQEQNENPKPEDDKKSAAKKKDGE